MPALGRFQNFVQLAYTSFDPYIRAGSWAAASMTAYGIDRRAPLANDWRRFPTPSSLSPLALPPIRHHPILASTSSSPAIIDDRKHYIATANSPHPPRHSRKPPHPRMSHLLLPLFVVYDDPTPRPTCIARRRGFSTFKSTSRPPFPRLVWLNVQVKMKPMLGKISPFFSGAFVYLLASN
jgi:hypothetical protein